MKQPDRENGRIPSKAQSFRALDPIARPTHHEVRAACVAVAKVAARVNVEVVFAQASAGVAQFAGAVRPHLTELREALRTAEQAVAAAEHAGGPR